MNNTTQLLLYKFLKGFTVARTEDENVKNTALTIIYASLIPLIVGTNLLLIFGIIKTKRFNFSSSQILFLTLFLSDFTIGVFQLPTEIYIKWKSSYPTCFEIQLAQFSRGFPICMSGTLLFVISIDRYIYVVHYAFHTRFVRKKILTTIIIVIILISIMWSLSDPLFSADPENRKVAKLYIALTVYVGILIATGVAVNVALLRNIKQKTKNLSVRRRALNSSLTKTITIIAAMLVISYVPLMINFAIFALTKDQEIIRMIRGIFAWTLIAPQINAVLNSVIYLTRNSRMRRYYHKLLNCESTKIHLQLPGPPVPKIRHELSPAL